jgi:hypothetical protein
MNVLDEILATIDEGLEIRLSRQTAAPDVRLELLRWVSDRETGGRLYQLSRVICRLELETSPAANALFCDELERMRKTIR